MEDAGEQAVLNDDAQFLGSLKTEAAAAEPQPLAAIAPILRFWVTGPRGDRESPKTWVKGDRPTFSPSSLAAKAPLPESRGTGSAAANAPKPGNGGPANLSELVGREGPATRVLGDRLGGRECPNTG